MKNNVIELTPYLPVQAAATPAEVLPERVVYRAKEALPYISALVESLVTVGIGLCFVMGLVISLVIAL